MRRSRTFGAAVLAISWAIAVWAAHFGVIYGYTGLACARRFDEAGATLVALVPWVVIGATLLAAALVALVLIRVRADVRFEQRVGAGLGALALIAIVLEGGAALWVPACA